jgi:benzylsuccinate CoA-transferase BbsF subunit
VKPDLIMLSSCLGGQYGPHADLAGFGTMGAQLAGFGELAGWPDRPPAGPFGAYTDYIAPKFTAAAILAALDHRRRTGEGQYIDLSQSECSQHFIAPALLDFQVNGHVLKRMGNRSLVHAPHGVFPCAGDDRWVAIAVENEPQWNRLREAIGNPEWAAAPELQSSAGRLNRQDELERGLAAWTRERSCEEVETILQSHGVPAFRSATSEDVLADPQLAHRRHFIPADHAELGPVTIENSRFILSDTPATIHRAGPVFGQDNEYVLRQLLGLTEDEVVEYIAAGAVE